MCVPTSLNVYIYIYIYIFTCLLYSLKIAVLLLEVCTALPYNFQEKQFIVVHNQILLVC